VSANRTGEQIVQTIANEVARVAPADWTSVSLGAKLLDDVGEVDFFYRNDKGLTKRFNPGYEGFYLIDQAFAELRRMMKASGHSWNKARFDLDRSGKLKIDFDYDNPG
jgi:hypothetical protein